MFGYITDDEYITTIIPIKTTDLNKPVANRYHASYQCDRAIGVTMEHKKDGYIKIVFPKPLLKQTYYLSIETALETSTIERCTIDKGIFLNRYQNGQKMNEYLSQENNDRYREWNENGRIRKECYYKDNRLNGPYLKWYDNGKKHVQSYLRNGKFQGPYREWYDNGKIQIDMYYQNDQPHKKVSSWYENGRKYVECYYHLSKKNGLYREWHSNGEKFIECYYLKDKRHGLYLKWYPHGKKQLECHYKNGARHGKCLTWDENGKQSETFYRYGHLIPIQKSTNSECIVCQENIEKRQEYYQCRFEHSYHSGCINARPEWVKNCVYCQNKNIYYING
jgi:antitoxin component YwqK of YwqJK toxin-antitoxin module